MSNGSGKIIAIAESVLGKIAPSTIQNEVDEWLGEHITNPNSPPLDRSLSSSSSAAPADMVGDLKSANDVIVDTLTKQKTTVLTQTYSGYIDASTGSYTTNSNYITYKYEILAPYAIVRATGANTTGGISKNIAFISFLDKDRNATVRETINSRDNTIYTREAISPKDSKFVRVCVAKAYVNTYGVPAVDIKNIFDAAEIDNRFYYSETDTDAFVWSPGRRVNILLKGYSTGVDLYAGMFVSTSPSNVHKFVYAGSTITVKSGYTADYAVTDQSFSESFEGERGISGGTTIRTMHDGILLISVSDGTTNPATVEEAKQLAKSAIEINFFAESVKDRINQNANAIVTTNDRIDDVEEKINIVRNPELSFTIGVIGSAGDIVNYRNRVLSSFYHVKKGDYIDVDTDYTAGMFIYDDKVTSAAHFIKKITATGSRIVSDTDGYARVQISKSSEWASYSTVLIDTSYQNNMEVFIIRSVSELKDEIDRNRAISNQTELYECQRAVAKDWHFPFIDVYNQMGLGNNHQIPGTASIWTAGNADLTQKNVWMSDGTHPFKGDGVTDMYGLTIAQQLALVSPSFHNAQVSPAAPYWTGKNILWMGTSIPASSDPDAGQGTGLTYPALVAGYLGATVTNKAKGSSCVRANSSSGDYDGFMFSHFIRSITRMIDECDYIADNWATIKTNIANAPETLSESNVETMKTHSFENLIMPYLNGTNPMPDLFVIDYGHNDVRPRGVDGEADLWVQPTSQNIRNGILASDEYMVSNNYANLKLAMNNNLSGITDIDGFAASVNRNCLQGALNFLITVILSKNPYARIAIVSDFN